MIERQTNEHGSQTVYIVQYRYIHTDRTTKKMNSMTILAWKRVVVKTRIDRAFFIR
jgi:hypothetical protein